MTARGTSSNSRGTTVVNGWGACLEQPPILQARHDAHLTREQTKASAAAEGMTIYMTLPALIFSLIFLVAALLRIFFPETP